MVFLTDLMTGRYPPSVPSPVRLSVIVMIEDCDLDEIEMLIARDRYCEMLIARDRYCVPHHAYCAVVGTSTCLDYV